MLVILISICSLLKCEPGSSDSIVSGYGLEDRAIEVQSPQRRKDLFSSLCAQKVSEAHPASCPMGAGGPLPQAPSWYVVGELFSFSLCKDAFAVTKLYITSNERMVGE
jgi:hypothetical protein